MKYIILSDTHFGIKQNSVTWMNSQLDFMYKELMPYIKKLRSSGEQVAVIHCGDVFDSRSSINPLVASRVRQMFKDLSVATNHEIYIVAGNHDFYSPNDDSITALKLLLNDLQGVTLVIDKPYELEAGYLVPWYVFMDKQQMKMITERHPKRIFCHTDLLHLESDYINMLKGIDVYSGHIHTPHRSGNLITLGSTFALTFADCNAKRGFYILDDNTNQLEFRAAEKIIHFWRFHNQEILSINPKDIKGDYIELYIDKTRLTLDEYSKQISRITASAKECQVMPPTEEQVISESIVFENYNIEQICRQNIPDNLLEKFEQIAQ